MIQQAFEYLFSQIQNATILTDPYPHFYVEQAFPDDFYCELLKNIPDRSHYRSLSETGKVSKGSYKERFIIPLQDERLPDFWHRFYEKLETQDWISLLVEKFQEPLQERFGWLANSLRYSSVAELIKDETHYSITPHTDLPHRVCTLLFYFPRTNAQAHLGTSIYRPKDPTWTCEGNGHYRFEDFIKEKTVPFLPNSLFGFLKSDRSFHGVEPITDENATRDLLNTYLKWSMGE